LPKISLGFQYVEKETILSRIQGPVDGVPGPPSSQQRWNLVQITLDCGRLGI
jgi:hypothetical protein